MEQDTNQLNHSTWECKYHVVFRPKYRKKVLFGKIRQNLGKVFHDLARRKECKIEGGGTLDAGSCAYADLDTAEIFGGRDYRVHEGQKLYLGCAECRT